MEYGGFNFFDYCYGDPVDRIDPTGLKPGDRFSSPNDAAIDVINHINPRSIAENVEYGGYIYRNDDGSHSATPPATSGSPSETILGPIPADPCADYHTHGATDPNLVFPGFGKDFNEGFSETDKFTSDHSGRPSYLGTPKGGIWRYDPSPKKNRRGPTTRLR
jgi:hypothetical protein